MLTGPFNSVMTRPVYINEDGRTVLRGRPNPNLCPTSRVVLPLLTLEGSNYFAEDNVIVTLRGGGGKDCDVIIS